MSEELIRRALAAGSLESGGRPAAIGVQNMTTGGDASNNLQVLVVSQSRPEFFVHLAVFEGDASEPLTTRTLLPGRRYRVEARASENPSGSGPDARMWQQGVRLGRHPLRPRPSVGTGMRTEIGDVEDLSLDNWNRWSFGFDVELSSVGAVEEVEIGLGLLPVSGDPAEPSRDLAELRGIVLTRAVTVRFGVAVNSSAAPNRSYLREGEPPPPGTIVIHVVPHDDESVRVEGMEILLDDPRLHAVPLRRPERTRLETEPARAMNDFALQSGASLRGWLDHVLDKFEEKARFVILDQDRDQIPWELFTVRANRRWGTEAPVVRWVDTPYLERLSILEDTRTGQVAALVDGTERAHWDSVEVELCEHPSTLMDVLLAGKGRFGLVCLSLPGVLLHGDEGGVEAHARSGTAGSMRLDLDDLQGRLDPRPIVIADSPFAGKLLRKGDAWCGLAHAALQRWAAGFLGPVRNIDRDFARASARELVEAAREANGVCVAEWLWEIRRSAAQRLHGASTAPERDAAKRAMEDALLLVFYGGPRVRVHVIGASMGGRA